MSDVILPFTSTTLRRRARIIRERARQLHVEAVRHLELGNRDRYWTLLRDVADREEEALRLERQAERVDRVRRETAAACEHILAIARAGKS